MSREITGIQESYSFFPKKESASFLYFSLKVPSGSYLSRIWVHTSGLLSCRNLMTFWAPSFCFSEQASHLFWMASGMASATNKNIGLESGAHFEIRIVPAGDQMEGMVNREYRLSRNKEILSLKPPVFVARWIE